MPLTKNAQKAIPEIATWLHQQAATEEEAPLRAAGLRAAAEVLLRETGRLTLDDTDELFCAASGRAWAWGTWSPLRFSPGPTQDSAPTGWTRAIIEKSTGRVFELSHAGMVAAMVQILNERDAITAADDPALTRPEVLLIANVLGAPDRAALNAALVELFERLCLVIVQFAVFGEYRYRDAS